MSSDSPCVSRLILLFFHIFLLTSFVQSRTASEAQVQCSASCLAFYRTQAAPADLEALRLNPDRIMMQCNGNNSSARKACWECLNACGLKMKPASLSVCAEKCQPGSSPCLRGCRFLVRLLTTNPGRCPTQAKKSGSAMFRYPKCEADRDCYRKGNKCCPLGRQQTCVKAEMDVSNLPPTPSVPLVLTNSEEQKKKKKKKKRIKQLTMVLDWSHYNLTAVPDPIIFLVQIRAYKGYKFDASAVSLWIDLVMTSQRRAVLADLKAGTWYQLRIGAISQFGLRGYSPPTSPQKLREARRPSPPRGLSEGVSRIHDRSKVDVLIRWEPPKRRDLPISKYELTWREHYSFRWGEERSSSKFTASAPASVKQFMIRDLKPSTMYKIELSAIVHYGTFQLRSKRVSLFITTTSIPTEPTVKDGIEKDPRRSDSSTYNESDCLCGTPSPPYPLSIGASFYEEGKVKVPIMWNKAFKASSGIAVHSFLLEWSPKVCVASDSSSSLRLFDKPFEATVDDSKTHYLSGLLFKCHYSLHVRGLTDTGQMAMSWRGCFCTASCRHLRAIARTESARPACPGETTASVPQRPLNVQHRLWRAPKDLFSARITWDVPSSTAMSDIRSYSIEWGPRVFEPVDRRLYGLVLTPKLDLDRAESKVVVVTKNRHTIHGLEEGTIYIVRLKFITRNGDSPVTAYYFRTPGQSEEERVVETVTASIVRPLVSGSASALPSILLLLLALLASR